MMRTQDLALCALGALFAAGLAFGSASQKSDPEVAALRKQVEVLEEKVEVMSAFLVAQEAAGAALMDSLARSEAEGFTAGINPKSREILLEGLRTQAKAMQAADLDDEEGEEEDDRRRGRGRRGR